MSRTATTVVTSGSITNENAKVALVDDRAAKEPMLLRKHLRIPFDPRHRLVKASAKPDLSILPPRIVEVVSVAKILVDQRQKLDRLTSHRRATRRSNSSNEIRSTLPERYAFHRESRSARSSALTGRRSSTPARHSSSASFSFCRFGSFWSSGKCARAMDRNVRIRLCRSTPASWLTIKDEPRATNGRETLSN
jgi:hypothetical protein